MNYDEDRILGIQIAQRLGATETVAAIDNKQNNFEDIFSTAITEIGLDAFAAELLNAPPVWAHMALLHFADLGDHREALLKRAAEAPDGTVSPGSDTTGAVEESSAVAATLGGPLSIMSLHNAMAADCQWTAKWMDGGAEQPITHYADWNDWLWSGTLTAGCGSTIALPKFAEKVPESPLQKGDEVWIYVWVAAGSDKSGKDLTFQFTYDPSSTMAVYYNISGTTTINSLSVAAYK